MPSSKEIKDFERGIAKHPERPRILCFGDSWFNYPLEPIDLNKQLERLYPKCYFYNESVAGRESSDLKKLRPRLQRLLENYQFKLLLLSMGGNDVVGSELAEFIKRSDEPQDMGTRAWGNIPALVDAHIHLASFNSALNYLASDYQQIINLRNQARPNCEIVIHNYDYPWPDGKSYKLFGKQLAGPWIRPFMKQVGVSDFAEQRAICRWLIDQFSQLQQDLLINNSKIHCVDSRGLLPDASDWDNEIHPDRKGFKRIAQMAWKPVLDALLV